jgi:hypothetical protein
MTDKEAMAMALEALELLTGAWHTFDALDYGDNAIAALKERLAQPEQEPVAWRDADGNVSDNNDHKCFPIPLYTHPPQRTWVGLTDEEIKEFDTWHDNREEEVGWCNPSEIVAYIEAKLKEKNT